MIHQRDFFHRLTRQDLGLISIAGPATNVCLAIAFFILYWQLSLSTFWEDVFWFGAYINAFLAVFNLIPFGPFDGKKIFDWDRTVWGVSLGVALVMYVGMILW